MPISRSVVATLVLSLVLLAAHGVFRSQRSINLPHPELEKSNPQPGRITSTPREDAGLTARLLQARQILPLTFEPNEGQSDSRVKFLAGGRGYRVLLSSSAAELFLRPPSVAIRSPERPVRSHLARWSSAGDVRQGRQSVLKIQLDGVNRNARISAIDPVPGTSNYFVGKDPKRWRTNIPHFLAVRYQDVYPAIDLIYHGSKQGQLEFDFVVRPGARPDSINLTFQGVEWLDVDNAGDLVLHLDGSSTLVAHRPVVYQQIAGQRRRKVDGKYLVTGKSKVAFRTSSYDKSEPLVIDPVLSYSTYLGGSASDSGLAIAVDSFGNAYIAGDTGGELPVSGESPIRTGLGAQGRPTFHAGSNSSVALFPITKNAFQTIPGGGDADAFVSKLNSRGSALIYSTFLGGDAEEKINGIAVDSSGNAYLTGLTSSSNFPTTIGAFHRTLSGPSDVFVTKLNASGSGLVYSTYLGGSSDEQGNSIASDSSGNAYVTGATSSRDFPTTAAAFQNAFSGGSNDAFVTKLNSAGKALLYSSYLGGDASDEGRGIAVDAAGHALIAGATISMDFPTTSGALQPVLAGSGDAFVSKLDEGGKSLMFSTFLGGHNDDEADAIALDVTENIYVTGSTFSSDFPTTRGAFHTGFSGGFTDAFVTSLNPNGTTLRYSTYLGGNDNDLGKSIAVDRVGNASIAGLTFSTDFPATAGALRTALGSPGEADAFMTRLKKSGAGLLYSSYLGGSGEDGANSVGVDPAGNSYFTGFTLSSNFPTTAGAFQTSTGGNSDVFVTKLAAPPPDCGSASASVATLLPHNHRFVAETIQGVVGPGPTRITITSIGQDEPVRGKGDHSCADGAGVGTTQAQVRAERSGKGDGRVYSIGFLASDGNGAICRGQVKVCVPHDRARSTCKDQGALYDSTHC